MIYFYPGERRLFQCMAATDLEFGALHISSNQSTFIILPDEVRKNAFRSALLFQQNRTEENVITFPRLCSFFMSVV